MLNLYQDIFKGHGATNSHTFISKSVGDEDDMEEDEQAEEVDCSEEEEFMLCSRFSPTMNILLRSVGKGRSRGKAKKTTLQLELVDAMKELVAHIVREV